MLKELIQAALEFINGRRVVADFLRHLPVDSHMSKLIGEGVSFDLVAIGKAAPAMAAGVMDGYRNNINQGLVITKYDHAQLADMHWPDSFRIIEAAHPIPDQNSLLAGRVLIDYVRQSDIPLLFLLSGGASSLVEDLVVSVTLAQCQALNHWLLNSGLPIAIMNRMRQQISTIKGGGLCASVRSRPVLQLLMSDVPGDDPSVIGSGPLFPVDEPITDSELLEWKPPTWFLDISHEQRDRSTMHQLESHLVLNNLQCRQFIANWLVDHGQRVIGNSAYQGTVEEVTEMIVHRLIQGGPGWYLWGGECTVKITGHSGKGGRNQHLACLLANRLVDEPVRICCVASDGGDGPGLYAGACVDGQTKYQAEQRGLTLLPFIQNYDSGTFLEQMDLLINTGPTGSNVMDLIVVEKIAL